MKALSLNSNIMGLGLLVLLFFSLKTALGGTKVTHLPGYVDSDGASTPLPFTLETGYVEVDEKEGVQFFYYFVESQINHTDDPLMLIIPEGPGCTGLAPFFYGKGPLALDTTNYTVGLPKLFLNSFAWTEGFNIIFLDGPVGTGFSYSNTEKGYSNISDTIYADHIYTFLLKWLQNNTEFSKHQLYVAGEGYAGNLIPLVIDKILKSEEDINIKGYVLGNPGTSYSTDFNAKPTAAFRLGLIPEKLYEEAYKNCDNGNFTMENPSAKCNASIQKIDTLIENINPSNILQPLCSDVNFTLTLKEQTDDSSVRRYLEEKSDAQETQSILIYSIEEKSRDFLNLQYDAREKQCSGYSQMVYERWANDKSVQTALHVRKETKTSWTYCNHSDLYVNDVKNVIGYHRNFTTTNLQALIYSGDHDISIPYIGTLEWILKLGLQSIEDWSPWSVENEVAGYTLRLTNQSRYNLTFATVKGAGHYAVQDKPRECSEMFKSWMVNGTLSVDLP